MNEYNKIQKYRYFSKFVSDPNLIHGFLSKVFNHWPHDIFGINWMRSQPQTPDKSVWGALLGNNPNTNDVTAIHTSLLLKVIEPIVVYTKMVHENFSTIRHIPAERIILLRSRWVQTPVNRRYLVNRKVLYIYMLKVLWMRCDVNSPIIRVSIT